MPGKITEAQLKCLKENLPTFRKILGYSADELGKLIGLTRQSVTNLETGKTPLTPLHFRAISHIINEVRVEKIENGGNSELFALMQLLIYLPEELGEEYKAWERAFKDLSILMSAGSIDDPLERLMGLQYGSYGLEPGDVVPVFDLLTYIAEEDRQYFGKIMKKLEESEDEGNEKSN